MINFAVRQSCKHVGSLALIISWAHESALSRSTSCFAGYSFTNEPFTNHASMLALLRSLHYILRGAGFANGIWKYKTVGKCSWI